MPALHAMMMLMERDMSVTHSGHQHDSCICDTDTNFCRIQSAYWTQDTLLVFDSLIPWRKGA